MMLKKGTLVLRDIVFMMMIVSSIFVLSGIFVSKMALNYENTNMTNEWALAGTNTLANSTFYETEEGIKDNAAELNKSTGIWSLIGGGLDAIGSTLFMVLTAPNTIGNLVGGTLVDAGISSTVATIIEILIVSLFWIIIIFSIVSAFLQGGKL